VVLGKKKSNSSVPDDTPELTFEQSLERLEDVVRQLEQGKIGLSESLERYEEGVRFLRLCYRTLETAERKIELLAGVDSDGNARTEAFDDDDLTIDEKAVARSRRRSRSKPRKDDLDDPADSTGSLF
jgi:exodeoxyribonuclease VII small subunit